MRAQLDRYNGVCHPWAEDLDGQLESPIWAGQAQTLILLLLEKCSPFSFLLLFRCGSIVDEAREILKQLYKRD